MWKYCKRLEYPINIKSKDLKMAKLLLEQLGGANGEISAALRYLVQRFSMPDDMGRALLSDIGSEELGHCEMIATMAYQLMKDASIDEIKNAGLDNYYAAFGKGIFPVNASGIPFTAAYINSLGDVIADLQEDMAAEQKARAVYENLMNLTNDPEVLKILSFLRQREVVHFNRFKELYEHYKMIGY